MRPGREDKAQIVQTGQSALARDVDEPTGGNWSSEGEQEDGSYLRVATAALDLRRVHADNADWFTFSLNL